MIQILVLHELWYYHVTLLGHVGLYFLTQRFFNLVRLGLGKQYALAFAKRGAAVVGKKLFPDAHTWG
jgi:hypothetical protein